MKRNKFIFSVLFGFTVLILSCSKDESQNAILQQGLQTRTSTPSTINGLLSFSTYQDFENFVTNLKNQEQDSTTVRNAFTTLGIDLNAEQTTNITDYPVCRLTENAISGFTSARRIEEDVINADLNSGGDAFSIIEDVYLKTALNADMSVHIGSRIFKFYENGGVAIILNNDWVKYNEIKNLPFSYISQSQNLIVKNNEKETWSDLYNFGMDGNLLTEKIFTNPVFVISGDIPPCDHIKFTTVTFLDNGQIRFEANYPFDLYQWTFSDESTATGKVVIKSFTQDGSVNLIVSVNDPTSPSGKRIICQVNIWFTIKSCGEKRTRKDELIRTINGQTWRIQASIWVRSGEVGCEMSYRKKGFLGRWWPASNRGVCTDLSGTYKRELANKSCIDVSANGIECLGNGTFPTSISVKIPDVDKIFREPNMLSSGHRLNVNGTWFGFGLNGVPRLILD